MELFAKILNAFTFFAKSSILDVLQGSKYANMKFSEFYCILEFQISQINMTA